MRKYMRYRQVVIAASGESCGICGMWMSPKEADIDHIVPASAGGTDDLSNLRAVHRRCNNKRSNHGRRGGA